MDENCNGLADGSDPGVDPSSETIWYADADGDRYGDPTVVQRACDQPFGYVGAGGFDGDGNPDLLVGLGGYDNPLLGVASASGAAVVLYGPLSGSHTFGALSGTDHAVYLGTSTSAHFGAEAVGVGDLNGDAYDDLFLAAPAFINTSNLKVGKGYVYYGNGQ